MAELGLRGGGARPKLPDGTTDGRRTRGYKVNQLTAGMGELINNARADGPERPRSPGEQEGNSRATVHRYGPVYDDVLYRLLESGLSGEPEHSCPSGLRSPWAYFCGWITTFSESAAAAVSLNPSPVSLRPSRCEIISPTCTRPEAIISKAVAKSPGPAA